MKWYNRVTLKKFVAHFNYICRKKTYITKEQWSAEINKVHFFINNKWLNQNTETEKLKCHHVHPSSWGSLFFEYNSLLHFLWMRARTLVFGNCFIIYPYLPILTLVWFFYFASKLLQHNMILWHFSNQSQCFFQMVKRKCFSTGTQPI